MSWFHHLTPFLLHDLPGSPAKISLVIADEQSISLFKSIISLMNSPDRLGFICTDYELDFITTTWLLK